MRIGHLLPTRPEWYDRHPATFMLGGAGDGVNPGGGGIYRFTYTVPTGKKAYLDSGMVALYQMTYYTVGTVAGVFLFVFAGGQEWVILAKRTYSNVPGEGSEAVVAAFGILNPGDYVRSFDSSDTNMTYNVRANIKITEFDA